MICDSILQTIQYWTQSFGNNSKAKNTAKNLRIALKLYCFEGLGCKTRAMKTTEFEQFCINLSIKQWVLMVLDRSQKEQLVEPEDPLLQLSTSQVTQFINSVLQIFDQQFDTAVSAGLTSFKTKRNYRSALGRFIKWAVEQVWWQELFPEDIPETLPYIPRGLVPPRFSKRGSHYSLREEQLPSSLQKELADFKEFRITGGKKAFRKRSREAGAGRNNRCRPKLVPIKESSFEQKEKRFILMFLGWCVNINGESLEILSLEDVTDIDRIQDYIYWLVDERQRTHATGIQITSIAIAIAKWKNYHTTQRRNWSDIQLIEDLRDLSNFFAENYDRECKSSLEDKWRHKELTHSQARQIVQYLRQLCATHCSHVNSKTGQRVKTIRRTDSVIVRAWQTYLLVKFLVYLPVRQQEIRQLKLEQTLFRKIDERGNPFYVASIKDHKLQAKTLKNRHYKIPAILTQDLDDWIRIWRSKAAKAVASLEAWLAFWGHSLDDVGKLQQRLDAASQGNYPPSVKNPQSYIQELERKIQCLERRINDWKLAKLNFEKYNSLFFNFGSSGAFGQPLTPELVYYSVRWAVATATVALSQDARWTNPHCFRHIAAKHIRQIQGETETLAKLMGHSFKMSDMYAEQILTDYDATETFVDDWWEPS